MHRFFLPELQPQVDEVVSLVTIHGQLSRVLRVQPGEPLIVLDNSGNERLLEVASVERRDTTARVLEVRPAPPEPTIEVTLYQCALKADKFDLLLQKVTELGVTTIVPVVSNRTVARVGRVLIGKIARWERIVREASEQCGRGRMPVIAPPMTFAEALAQGAGVRLLPWEEGVASPGLVAAMSQAPQPVEAVSILVGPEGGLEAGEVTDAIDAGWQVVSLGQRILRAETAAIAALTIVTSALGELGDAPLVKLPPAVKGKPKEENQDRSDGEVVNEEKPKPEKAETEKPKTEKAVADKAKTGRNKRSAKKNGSPAEPGSGAE